jgi:hypothetical protein
MVNYSVKAELAGRSDRVLSWRLAICGVVVSRHFFTAAQGDETRRFLPPGTLSSLAGGCWMLKLGLYEILAARRGMGCVALG